MDANCSLPMNFLAIWIRDNYLDVIRQEADKLVGYAYSVELLGSYEDEKENPKNRLTNTTPLKSTRTTGPSLHGRSLLV